MVFNLISLEAVIKMSMECTNNMYIWATPNYQGHYA